MRCVRGTCRDRTHESHALAFSQENPERAICRVLSPRSRRATISRTKSARNICPSAVAPVAVGGKATPSRHSSRACSTAALKKRCATACASSRARLRLKPPQRMRGRHALLRRLQTQHQPLWRFRSPHLSSSSTAQPCFHYTGHYVFVDPKATFSTPCKSGALRLSARWARDCRI